TEDGLTRPPNRCIPRCCKARYQYDPRGTTAKRRRGITKSARRSLPRCVHSTKSAASSGSIILRWLSLFHEKGAEGMNPLLGKEEREELLETVDAYRIAQLVQQGINLSLSHGTFCMSFPSALYRAALMAISLESRTREPP